jgi:hypothetical protein
VGKRGRKELTQIIDADKLCGPVDISYLHEDEPFDPKPVDPFAGQKIRCFICNHRIKKGEHFWHLGQMITCKPCHDFVHGDD